CQQYNDFLPTF
nr:immunoglobulin light chain junction region [Macaca mulatta]MOW08041.1 immunoglobulin light chain junction region [Macaca mulatta]MOW08455.1 immunoglobulin light chain junction region [Macaca mulatta]MOW08594.1 immunoglobulin light chain junction region [Macaca mulatta]MOW08809.1 immunoglobulin light chain junction region [Macaca mulatta]